MVFSGKTVKNLKTLNLVTKIASTVSNIEFLKFVNSKPSFYIKAVVVLLMKAALAFVNVEINITANGVKNESVVRMFVPTVESALENQKRRFRLFASVRLVLSRTIVR